MLEAPVAARAAEEQARLPPRQPGGAPGQGVRRRVEDGRRPSGPSVSRSPNTKSRCPCPAAGQEIVFTLHQEGEASYATTSQSTKIITFEGTLLADLDRKVEELRERKVAEFYSWEADRIVL